MKFCCNFVCVSVSKKKKKRKRMNLRFIRHLNVKKYNKKKLKIKKRRKDVFYFNFPSAVKLNNSRKLILFSMSACSCYFVLNKVYNREIVTSKL